jgi:hypothetical protein
MSETVIKESESFRLIVKKNPCLLPKDLNSLEFVQEMIKDGEVEQRSTYQFFMTEDEIQTLCKRLMK